MRDREHRRRGDRHRQHDGLRWTAASAAPRPEVRDGGARDQHHGEGVGEGGAVEDPPPRRVGAPHCECPGHDERGEHRARDRGDDQREQIAHALDPEVTVGVEAQQQRTGHGGEHRGDAQRQRDAWVDVVARRDADDRDGDRGERRDAPPPGEQERGGEGDPGGRSEGHHGAGSGVEPGDPFGGGDRGDEGHGGGHHRVTAGPREEGREERGEADAEAFLAVGAVVALRTVRTVRTVREVCSTRRHRPTVATPTADEGARRLTGPLAVREGWSGAHPTPLVRTR